MKNKKIQGVIFDFNGTLLWDTPFHNLAFDIFLNKKGLPPITDEDKKVMIHGKGNRDIMNTLFRNVLSEPDVVAYTLEKELIYQELCKNDLHLASGAEDFIEWLRANSIPYCIGSSVGRENVDFYFENMNLGKWFHRDQVVYNDGSYRAKPYPDIFQAAAKKIGLKPSETLVFEDSFSGIKSAENFKAGKIIIVNSTNDDFSQFPYIQITDFNQVDKELFINLPL